MSATPSTPPLAPTLVACVVPAPRLAALFPILPVPDLTIHRIRRTHHGRTLLLLGHAAEHLAEPRISLHAKPETPSDPRSTEDAIHILLRLSREVFDEYAALDTPSESFDQLIFGLATRLLN